MALISALPWLHWKAEHLSASFQADKPRCIFAHPDLPKGLCRHPKCQHKVLGLLFQNTIRPVTDSIVCV